MLNAEFIDLFAECPADDVRRFLLRLAFDEYKIIAVIQIGAVPIDALGIIGDQAVLFLAKDFIQNSYRNLAAANQFPEHIAGADTLQLIHISHKDNLCAKSDTSKELPATYQS